MATNDTLKKEDLEFNRNADVMRLAVSNLNQILSKIYLGGGKDKIAKQHEQGKMTARDRIDYLLDKDKPRFEIGALAGYEMYQEHGGCPSGWSSGSIRICKRETMYCRG